MRGLVVLIGISLIFCDKSLSQCCSANPVAGNVNVGVIPKNSARTIFFYCNSYSDTYYTGSSRSDLEILKNSSYNYLGSILAFGLTNKLTIETELGYYINKSEVFNIDPEYTLKGWGFNNAMVSFKYPIYKKILEDIEITAGLGAKLPFTTEPLVVDGVRLPQTVNPSTGAYGGVAQLLFYKGYVEKGLRFFFLNRFEANAVNKIGYQFGNSFVSSLFVSKSTKKNFTGILQIRNENRASDARDKKTLEGSGSYLVFVSPQLVYTIKQKWNISVLVDFPVFRYYHGTQLSNKVAAAVTLMRDISF